jgi:hypothetical protein
MSRNGIAKRVEHRAVGEGGRRRGNDIIFPNIDMCLITLVGRFSQSPTKKNINPGPCFKSRYPLADKQMGCESKWVSFYSFR